jgi:RIO-like serine/threonine protein kinase
MIMNAGLPPKRVIKELKGHSGNKVTLIDNHRILYVEKVGDVKRNVERMSALYREMYPVPFIYDTDGETWMFMEYIHGLDMKEYLIRENVDRLSNFIIKMIGSLSSSSELFDYTGVYHQKLDFVDSCDDLPFKKQELIDKLPKELPKSNYHGDFTLENIIYDEREGFVLIDPVTIEYDSYIFDLAKLRQDLECKWFLRETNLRLDVKLQNLQEKIFDNFPQTKDDYLLILMLLRVYRHTEKDDSNRKFILKEINRLWK